MSQSLTLQTSDGPVANPVRWTHDEREVLFRQADKMNRGDVSSWARSTSHHPYAPNFRPYRRTSLPVEEPRRVKPESTRITSLTACEYRKPAERPHSSESVILPAEETDIGGIQAKRVKVLLSVRERMERHFAKCRRKKSKKVLTVVAARSVLDDCPASTLTQADLDRMRQASMERDL